MFIVAKGALLTQPVDRGHYIGPDLRFPNGWDDYVNVNIK